MEQWLWGGGRTDRHRRGRPYLSATLLSRPKDTRFLASESECGRSYMGLLREAAAKIMNRGPSEANPRCLGVERAMGIEPTRQVLPGLEDKPFGATTHPKCDWRVNFRGMWGYVKLRRDTSMCEIPGVNLPVVGLWPAQLRSEKVTKLSPPSGRSWAHRRWRARSPCCRIRQYYCGDTDR
jgi:hypothetical protein